jgi:ABC-2 type transport system permease protein
MLVGVHTLAIIPFSLIGLGIGYRLGQKGAVAVANIVFLAMAVLGGLWMPIAVLPQAMQTIAWALPSYHLGEMALMAAGQREAAHLWLHAAPLALITLAAALFAWIGEKAQAR